jgi:hypothetical protein
MVWQPEDDRFRFRVTTSTGAKETQMLSYAGLLADDDLPQGIDYKRIVVNNSAENCKAGQIKTSMDVLIDNVRLNAEAVP